MIKKLTIGLPRHHLEIGERRDFLPEFVGYLYKHGADLYLEHGYGSGMGFNEEDYTRYAPDLKFTSLEETYQQDLVIIIRYPGDTCLTRMKPGSCIISMMHYPTRPQRVEFLRSLDIEALSLDSIKDDTGRRVVENLRAVAWNGMKIAFKVLRDHYPDPGFEDPNRNPIKVTVMGAGAVGMYAIQAAVRYGDEDYWHKMAKKSATGVQVTAVEYDLTNHTYVMQQILKYTDILVDATQRPDPRRAVVPNLWIGLMRPYAVLLDLSVDPYICETNPPSIKGIEGIPQGNLDQYIFPPDDPAYDSIPSCVATMNRRYAVSCYSWPGIEARDCMDIYGKQLAPVIRTIIQNNGMKDLNRNDSFFHRAIARATLSLWKDSNNN
jgi:alanine dehydrogenase